MLHPYRTSGRTARPSRHLPFAVVAVALAFAGAAEVVAVHWWHREPRNAATLALVGLVAYLAGVFGAAR